MTVNTYNMIRKTNVNYVLNFLQRSKASLSIFKPVVALEKQNETDEKPSSEGIHINTSNSSSSPLYKKTSGLVASAFASLKNNTHLQRKSNGLVDEAIAKASSPEALLTLTTTADLSKGQALKILSTLAEWSVTGENNMRDFEKDSRFISLCEVIGRPKKGITPQGKQNRQDDLSVVLGVRNDDEAAKVINTFSSEQMIKVLLALAFKKRRSTPLLRSLATNISQTTEKLNVKQAADIMYALACLNFPDEVLLEKVTSDLYDSIPQTQKTAVIGSISTSIGLLRLKDIDLLDILCEWMVKNKVLCRPQDIVSLLHTLAIVNHHPTTCENFFQEVRPQLVQADLSGTWLDVVWSLTLLQQATPNDFQSVLNKEFYRRLLSSYSDNLPVSCKKKLLNINGVATWTQGYQGPLLDVKEVGDSPSSRSKDKQALVTSVFDALSNLLPSSIYLRTSTDLGMGFILDGECLVDSKLTPLPLVDRKTGEPITKPSKGTKVAILVWDYHEHSKGHLGLGGLPALCERLTESAGYRVLSVPYTEFSPRDSLITRVQYIEKKLKLLVHPT